MNKEIKVGSYIEWRELGGTKHKGFVEEMDSNLAVVACDYHDGKKCCYDNC